MILTLIILGIIVLFFYLCYIGKQRENKRNKESFKTNKSNNNNKSNNTNKNINNKNSNRLNPILIVHKSGGQAKLKCKLEIFNDKSYNLYENGNIINKGYISYKIFNNVMYFVNNINYFDDIYNNIDNRSIYFSFEAKNKKVTFDFYDEDLPNDIFENFKPINALIHTHSF